MTLEGDLLEDYRSGELEHVAPEYEDGGGGRQVTPIDHGEVCLNVDRGWFAERGVAPPRTLDDLTEPRYRSLLVVENPATSSPGLSFLLATVARYGEHGWEAYWRALRSNGVLAVDDVLTVQIPKSRTIARIFLPSWELEISDADKERIGRIYQGRDWRALARGWLPG